MIHKNWKRFTYIEGITVVFMLTMFGLYFLKRDTQLIKIPSEIIAYLLWLSLGLYVGFYICKEEYRKVIKKNREDNIANNN